jgi:glucosamine--fructose-6-phosphate aminotransferase (isomerizing)
MLLGAVALIGHARYATHGSVADNVNNHPHPSDGGWVVHNGVVHNHRELTAAFGLHPSSACDSEVLARIVETSPGHHAKRLAFACGAAVGNCAVLGLWKESGLHVARSGNPVHCQKTETGFWIASLPASLPEPSRAQAFLDNSVRVLPLDRKRRRRVKVRKGPRESLFD